MKKLLILIVITCLNLPLYADFKLLFGLNLSNFRGTEETQWNFKMGFQGGIGIEFDLSNKMLVEFNVMYMKKGSVDRSTSPYQKYALNVISVPVLIRVKLFNGSSPYAVTGIELANKLSYSLKEQESEPVDLGGTIKGLDYGIIFGGGYEIELEEELFLFFELRYHLGMRNLLIDPLDGLSRKTSAVVLFIGIRS
ncbi:outer membrane beta-barrel protein [Acidobacteriota bacterium]